MMINKKLNIFWLLLFILFIYFIYRSIKTSVLINPKDRVNILIYGKNTSVVSIDKNNTNFIINFPASVKLLVPGGYKYYRSGSLGKLAYLEKKTFLLHKTYSSTIGSFIDLYFYPKTEIVYYDDQADSNYFNFKTIMLSSTNANWIDRIIFYFKTTSFNSNNLKIITDIPMTKTNDEMFFNNDKFNSQFQGMFYRKNYRESGDNVQIIYQSSYSTAVNISQIIEGSGIRVVDITSDTSQSKKESCKVIASNNKINSIIVKDLSHYFNCKIEVGETIVSDIILNIGQLEEEWAVM